MTKPKIKPKENEIQSPRSTKRKHIRRYAKCDSCAVVIINGTACHETGCPNKHIDPWTGRAWPRR